MRPLRVPALRWWLLVAIAPIAGSLAWHLAGLGADDPPPPPAAVRPSDEGSPDGVAAASPRPARCRFQVGDRLTFRVTTESRVVLDGAALLAGAHGGGSRGASLGRSRESKVVQGDLLWKVLSEEKREDRAQWTLLATLGNARGSVNDERLPDDVAAQLAEPVLVEIDDRCDVARVGTSAHHPPSVRRQWQLWLGLIAFALPDDALARSWSLEQTDPTGRYRAVYRRSAADDTVERKKVAYLRANSPGNDVPVSVVIRSARATTTASTAAGPDGPLADRWFDALQVDEHLEVRTEEQRLFADVATRFSMHRAPTDDDDAFWTAAFDLAPVTWLSIGSLAPDTEAALRFAGLPVDPALATLSAKEVVARFEALLAAERKKEDALRLMVQYLRIDPAHVTAVVELVRAGAFSAAAQPYVFLALQLTGGAPARDALIAIAHDGSFSQTAQLQAISALKDVPAPDVEVVNALRSLTTASGTADDQRATVALLGAGSLASKSTLAAPLRDELNALLHDTLEQAATPEEVGGALAALANTKNPDAAPIIEAYLDDPAASVRAAALGALGSTGASLPVEGTLDRLSRETDPRVARELGKHLAAQAQSASDTNVRRAILLLQAPNDTLVRASLIAFLGGAAADNELAMQALIAQFAAEKDPALLSLIGRFVPAERLP